MPILLSVFFSFHHLTHLPSWVHFHSLDRIRYPSTTSQHLHNYKKVLIGVGDMLGPPGCDPSTYSSASIAVALAPLDTVRDVKKKLISAVGWTDETPSDFGLFDDVSEEPLKDGQTIEAALAHGNSPSGGKAASRRGGGGRAPAAIRVPRPYVGVLWAARD